jgi:hypothetical protein
MCAIEGIGPKLAETLVDFFTKLKRRGPQVEMEDGEADGAHADQAVYQLKPPPDSV